ncbi:MAG: hypothetical protein LBU19_02070 [Treponema sp.]|jgi:hypothetical protein|nr:hypothetical protein [Treponema sp.]
MRAQDSIDFRTIDWTAVDREKAEFIYRDALEFNRGILENINVINDKAMGLLSFTMPIMAALVGFFVVSWANTSASLFAAAVTACAALCLVLIFLLVVIVPYGIHSGTGSPMAYFTAEFYKGSMKALLIGNIMTLCDKITANQKILYLRGYLLKIAVLLCALSPFVCLMVFWLSHYLEN